MNETNVTELASIFPSSISVKKTVRAVTPGIRRITKFHWMQYIQDFDYFEIYSDKQGQNCVAIANDLLEGVEIAERLEF